MNRLKDDQSLCCEYPGQQTYSEKTLPAGSSHAFSHSRSIFCYCTPSTHPLTNRSRRTSSLYNAGSPSPQRRRRRRRRRRQHNHNGKELIPSSPPASNVLDATGTALEDPVVNTHISSRAQYQSHFKSSFSGLPVVAQLTGSQIHANSVFLRREKKLLIVVANLSGSKVWQQRRL